jgi:MoxR-like ATPase
MSDSIILNKQKDQKQTTSVKKEYQRFESHTKSLSDKANLMVGAFKDTLHTTNEDGLLSDTSNDLSGIQTEKTYINDAISLLKKDISKSEEFVRQHERFKKQINDIIYQLSQEETCIDDTVKKMQSPHIISTEILKDIDQAKLVSKPILIQGEEGIGKTALIHAFGVEYNHNIIRLPLRKNINVENLFFEKSLDKEHTIYGPLGNVIIELTKWKSKEDKIKEQEKGRIVNGPLEDDPTPVVLIEGIDRIDEDTAKLLLNELEKDHMSFNNGNFQEDFHSKIKPFVVIVNNSDQYDIPLRIYNSCYPIDISFPEYEKLLELIQLHFPEISHKLLNSSIFKFNEIRAHANIQDKPSLRELIEWIDKLLDEEHEEVQGILEHHMDILLKSKDDHEHFHIEDPENEVHYSIVRK